MRLAWLLAIALYTADAALVVEAFLFRGLPSSPWPARHDALCPLRQGRACRIACSLQAGRAGEVAPGDASEVEAAWYEEQLSFFPDDAALLCGFARFQQVVRGNHNEAARLYEQALLRDPEKARKTFLSLNAVEKAKQAGGVSLLDSVLEFRKIAGSGTVRRDAGDFAVKNEAGRREELVFPDLINVPIPSDFREGVHYIAREHGTFPRGFSWVGPGDLVILTRSSGERKFGEVMHHIGPGWQNSFQICVEANVTYPLNSIDRTGGPGQAEGGGTVTVDRSVIRYVPSSTRNERGADILYLTPAGYRMLGGRRKAAMTAGGLSPPAHAGTSADETNGAPAKLPGYLAPLSPPPKVKRSGPDHARERW